MAQEGVAEGTGRASDRNYLAERIGIHFGRAQTLQEMAVLVGTMDRLGPPLVKLVRARQALREKVVVPD